jgi:hypothetical protein
MPRIRISTYWRCNGVLPLQRLRQYYRSCLTLFVLTILHCTAVSNCSDLGAMTANVSLSSSAASELVAVRLIRQHLKNFAACRYVARAADQAQKIGRGFFGNNATAVSIASEGSVQQCLSGTENAPCLLSGIIAYRGVTAAIVQLRISSQRAGFATSGKVVYCLHL